MLGNKHTIKIIEFTPKYNLAVKRFRGTGLAQKLLKNLELFAKNNGLDSLYLATSKNLVAANHFYTKEGYKRTAQLPLEIPLPIAKIFYGKDL